MNVSNTVSFDNPPSTDRQDSPEYIQKLKSRNKVQVEENDSHNSSFNLEKKAKTSSKFTKSAKKKRKSMLNKTTAPEMNLSKTESIKRRKSVVVPETSKSTNKLPKVERRKTLVDQSISLAKVETKKKKSTAKIQKKSTFTKLSKKVAGKRRKSKSLGPTEMPAVTLDAIKKIKLNPDFELVGESERIHALHAAIREG